VKDWGVVFAADEAIASGPTLKWPLALATDVGVRVDRPQQDGERKCRRFLAGADL
jgi:hypothetical protein